VNTVILKNWLLGARPMPDENKIHPGGFLLALVNLILCFFGWIAPGSGIGIANDYSCEAVALLPGYALFVPLWASLIGFALLFLRRYCKTRLTYYACNTIIILGILASCAVVFWNFYAIDYVLKHFQPLY